MVHKNQLKAVTGVRFFAAIAVIAFHFSIHNASTLPAFIYKLISHGDVAVNFFFILSGFVLAYNYVDREIKTQSFWLSRFARVYPLYLLALIISLPFFIMTLQQGTYATYMTLFVACWKFLTELLLLQAWIPLEHAYINGPGWSISVEALFYFTFPFIARYISTITSKSVLNRIAIVWISAIVLQLPLLIIRLYFGDGSIRFANFIAYFPFLHLPGFLIGVCAGTLFRREYYFGLQRLNTLQKTCFEIALLVLCTILIVGNQLYSMMNQAIVLPFLALFIFSLALDGSVITRFLALKWVVLLGEISYAIYLLQIPINDLLRWVIDVVGLSAHGNLLYEITYLPAIIGVSLLSFYYIEKPARKKILGLAQARSHLPSATGHQIVGQPGASQ